MIVKGDNLDGNMVVVGSKEKLELLAQDIQRKFPRTLIVRDPRTKTITVAEIPAAVLPDSLVCSGCAGARPRPPAAMAAIPVRAASPFRPLADRFRDLEAIR